VSTYGRVIVCLGVLATVAGVVVLTQAGIAAVVVGTGLLGLAGIAFVALLFLLVGESEDRDRKRHPHG
jgi:hypothetical protein